MGRVRPVLDLTEALTDLRLLQRWTELVARLSVPGSYCGRSLYAVEQLTCALGSDAAGVVVRAAAEGGGPAVGTRVVALTSGAFAERVAVDVSALAEVPQSVDLAEAAALPVAGIAALQALRAGGLAQGKRVLVTGASGGVGRFAVQLAAHAGAYVIASVGSLARGQDLAKAGADEVVVGLEGVHQPVDLVLDNVGGPQMVAAWELLAPGGSLQSIGWTSGEPAVFQPYSTVGPPKSLASFS